MPRQFSIRTKPNPSIVVAYLRVSTDTERQALGAEAQRVSIVEWARRNRAEVCSWFVEQVTGSASLERRPVLLQALAEVSVRKAGALVVQRLDRFSRDPLTAALAEAELRRFGATLACADGAGSGDDPTAELIRGILVSVARFEKSLIRMRIKAALAVKKARGEYTGVAPFGFKVGDDKRSLVPHLEETAILAEVRALRASGLTIRGVQAAATERGLLSRVGKPLTVTAIHRMLANTNTRTIAPPPVPISKNTEENLIKTMPTSTGTLSFSRCPDERIFAELSMPKIDLWWNLAAELEELLPRMREIAREVLWAQIEDYATPADVPLFVAQLERVYEVLRVDGRAHVSCLSVVEVARAWLSRAYACCSRAKTRRRRSPQLAMRPVVVPSIRSKKRSWSHSIGTSEPIDVLLTRPCSQRRIRGNRAERDGTRKSSDVEPLVVKYTSRLGFRRHRWSPSIPGASTTGGRKKRPPVVLWRA